MQFKTLKCLKKNQLDIPEMKFLKRMEKLANVKEPVAKEKDNIKNENLRTEKLSDFFLSENFSIRNLGLLKVFPSENFRFSAILLKSLKTLII